MKRLILFIGLLTVGAIAYAADYKEVKETLKTEIIHFYVEKQAADLIAEINLVRESKAGAMVLETDYQLSRGSQAWANQLDGNFNHDTSQATGRFSGEAILFYEGTFDAARVVRQLMNSPEHRELITASKYSRVGIGIKKRQGVQYVVVRLE